MQERKTVGQLMEEMRIKAGAQNYHGHEYMDLQQFAEDTRHKNRSKPVGQETTLPLRRWIQSLQMEGATGWNPCLRIPMQLPYTKPRKDFCRKESSR